MWFSGCAKGDHSETPSDARVTAPAAVLTKDVAGLLPLLEEPEQREVRCSIACPLLGV